MPRNTESGLEALYQRILKSPGIRRAPLQEKLFKHLWLHRHQKTTGEDIWVKAWGNPADTYRPELKRKQVSHREAAIPALKESRHANYENPADNVRYHCSVLAHSLRDYFGVMYSQNTASGWVISLPEGGPKRGYQLQWRMVNDPQSVTRAFWQPHLDCGREISAVYIEQLFYQDWPRGFVFRYYDCNTEHTKDAIAELRQKHPDAYKEGLRVAYPFVAWGEVEARDLITRWFADHAFRKVQPVITRRLRDDEFIWNDSLILFGSAPGNRFVTDVLQHYPDLDMQLEHGVTSNGEHCGRVIVRNSTDDELLFVAPYNPVRTASGCTLDFNPDQGMVLAILTRVPNPHARDSAITILNTDFGRAVYYMASFLTDEERMTEATQTLNLPIPLPPYFQVLCAVPTRSFEAEHRPVPLDVLLWRPYKPKGI